MTMPLATESASFWSAFIGAGFASTLVGLLLGVWLTHRLNTDREKAAEKRLLERKRREASEAVVDILGAWIRSSYVGATNEDRWHLQTTYWRGILTLDEALLDVLLPRLANEADAVGTNEIIVRTRAVLLSLSEPDLSPDALNNWPPIPAIEGERADVARPE